MGCITLPNMCSQNMCSVPYWVRVSRFTKSQLQVCNICDTMPLWQKPRNRKKET